MKQTLHKCIIVILLVFGILMNSNAAVATEKNIPKVVTEYIESKYKNNNYKAFYVMKWNSCKVYQIVDDSKKGIVYGSPIYVLFNGKKVFHPSIEEMSILRYDVRVWYNYKYKKDLNKLTKKLSANFDKKMIIDDNTEPPNVPPALYKYANKYMKLNNNIKIYYVMDWKDQHVYRTYWSGYCSIFNEFTVILYDGHIIRRPNNEEFKAMLNPMRQAYKDYLNELTHSRNKG